MQALAYLSSGAHRGGQVRAGKNVAQARPAEAGEEASRRQLAGCNQLIPYDFAPVATLAAAWGLVIGDVRPVCAPSIPHSSWGCV